MSFKKILFLHGFFASGQCIPAIALRESLKSKAEVLTPDLPLHPEAALETIRLICHKQDIDLLAGNSCGSFYAQIIASEQGIPALLGNPYFMMTEFLKTRIGMHQYKAPRKDGRQDFTIDTSLIAEFEEVERKQFDSYNPLYKEMVWGLFGENDTLAHFELLYLEFYNHPHHFPGAHTPTKEEVEKWYAPLAERMLELYKKE